MTDCSGVGAVCRDCAMKAGYKPKDKVVGVWIGECGICHEQKPCTDLHHDWTRPDRKIGKKKETVNETQHRG